MSCCFFLLILLFYNIRSNFVLFVCSCYILLFYLFIYFCWDFSMVWGKHAEYQGCFLLSICQVIVF